jgi:hypothetical protein
MPGDSAEQERAQDVARQKADAGHHRRGADQGPEGRCQSAFKFLQAE